MRCIVTVARRELATQFFSPIAYGVITLYLLVSGVLFWMLVITFVTVAVLIIHSV